MQTAVGGVASPSVQYWRGREGEVDFVFEIEGTPIPIGFAYQSGQQETAIAALREFTGEYDTPVGFLLAGNTVGGQQPIENLGDGIIQLPYWLYLLLC
jgi:predicted AAA+ superfamily ATPase